MFAWREFQKNAMQVDKQIKTADRVVILSVSDELGDPDLLSLAIDIENDPEVKPDFSMLIDLRRADVRNVTSAGVRALADRPFALSPASRRGIVVPSELGFGMARMYATLRARQGGTTQVFRDFDEAQRWVMTGAR
jgi:hypothetical protein